MPDHQEALQARPGCIMCGGGPLIPQGIGQWSSRTFRDGGYHATEMIVRCFDCGLEQVEPVAEPESDDALRARSVRRRKDAAIFAVLAGIAISASTATSSPWATWALRGFAALCLPPLALIVPVEVAIWLMHRDIDRLIAETGRIEQ